MLSSEFSFKLLRLTTIDARGNVNFRILDPTGLSDNLDGVLGRFIPANAYQITEHIDNLGLLGCG